MSSQHFHYHDKYNHTVLSKVIAGLAKLFANNHALDLRQMLDPADSRLYLKPQSRLTTIGLSLLWRAIDSTIWFTDTLIFKANDKETRSFQIYEAPKVVEVPQDDPEAVSDKEVIIPSRWNIKDIRS